MDVKMVVSDLDGTLLNADSVIAPRTAETLQRAASVGIMIVAATGRSIHSALDLLRPVGVVSWALCSNGATCFHLAEEQLVSNTLIPADEVAELLERIRAEYGEIGLAWETESELRWDLNYQTHRDNLVPRPDRQEGRIAQFPEGADLVKLLITHAEKTHDQWLADLRPLVNDTMAPSTSGTDFVEITHATATKGQALARLCQRYSITADQVVAFGDQVNDLDMLQWAGRGYAMVNAADEVKAVAGYEAPHHNDDGVAQVLDELLDLG